MIAAAISTALGVFVVALIVWRLSFRFEWHTPMERISLGIIAGGMFLVTPALWIHGTPFDQWSFNLSRAGLALFFYATFVDRRHNDVRSRAADGNPDRRFAWKNRESAE